MGAKRPKSLVKSMSKLFMGSGKLGASSKLDGIDTEPRFTFINYKHYKHPNFRQTLKIYE